MNSGSLIQAEAKEVARLLAQAGYTQLKLASELGISQSQISRIFSGKLQRRTKLFDKLCILAYRPAAPAAGREGASGRQPELIAALDAVWDGTTAHAKALAVVIRSLGALKAPSRAPLGIRRGRPEGGGRE